MKSTVLSIFVCVLSLNLGVTSGLNWVECMKTGPTGPDVGCDADPILPEAKECNPPGEGGVPFCSRLTAKLKTGSEVIDVLARECVRMPESTRRECVKFTDPAFEGEAESCYCTTNNCNGHGTPVPTTLPPITTNSPVEPVSENNPAGQIMVAHFSLPLLGLALCQAYALM